MEENFELPVMHNGKELAFAAKLVQYGYSYKIEVDVDGIIVSFERDDSGKWRGLVDTSLQSKELPKPELIHSIVQSIEEILK